MSAIVHDTFVLERAYPKPPARVFAAFADPALKRRWYGESESHDIETFEADFRIGGDELVRYRFREGTPFPGVILTNRARYLDIIEGERIVLAQTMAMREHPFSAALITFDIRAKGAGALLVCTHQAAFFEGADGPEMRRNGWIALFGKLGAAL